MRFTYSIFSADSERLHIGVRPEQAILRPGQYMLIEDELKPALAIRISSQEELESWIVGQERAAAWGANKSWSSNKALAASTVDTQQILNKGLHLGIDVDAEDFARASRNAAIKLAEEHVNAVASQILADSNPKTAAAASKPRVSAVPPVAMMAMGAAMQDGANKYGRFNWRETSVTASVFYDAMMRHLAAWYSGETHAPDSGVHHLAHIMASCAIILDAELNGVFTDDRVAGHIVTPAEERLYKVRTDHQTATVVTASGQK